MDLLLTGGRVVDGLGGPPQRLDVGVGEGRIAHLGPGAPAADVVVDLEGLTLSPGFVDIHAHSDYMPLLDPYGYSRILDGVTLEVTGNCGMSPFPLGDEEAAQEAAHHPGLEVDWRDQGAYLDRLTSLGMGLDRAWLVGHGTLRARVVGYENRPPTGAELAEMEEILDACLRAGAVGLSTGLIYAPGCYAQPEEVVRLARVVERHGRLYASHIRGEGETLLEAIDEVLHVARESRVRTQVSHLKASKPENWEKLDGAIERIEAARAEGLDVMADRYPYTATSTGLAAVLPGWALEGGKPAAAGRTREPGPRRRLLDYLRNRHPPDYWARVQICSMGHQPAPEIEGKRVDEVSRERDADVYETALDLLSESEARAEAVYHVLDEGNLQRVLSLPWVMIGSDGGSLACEGPAARGRPHPRAFGTFARVLGRYVRDEGLLSLEVAVQKMTSMPADRIGVTDRGRIEVGARADLVAFDPDTIRDRATFEVPHAYSQGIEGVWVAGREVIKGGRHTGVLAGAPLLLGVSS